MSIFYKGVFNLPNYNSEFVYNAMGQDGGFFWNGANYIILLRLHETLRTIDNLSLKLAKLILNEKFDMFYVDLILSAMTNQTDDVIFDEDMTYVTTFLLAENMGFRDKLAELLVLAYLHDDLKLLDEARLFSARLSADDTINVKDIMSTDAFYELMDRFKMDDVELFVRLLMMLYDSAGLTDGVPNPKLSISDFIIGTYGDTDKAYDWFIPFNMKVDANNTFIYPMPEAEHVTASILGLDGELWEDCTYKDRLFSITAYSEQGLTIQEKEDLKTRICEILDSTKHQSKKLTVQDRGVSFNVKYTGQADISEGPSYVKMRADFLAQPYGYRTFEEDIVGSGLVDNGQGDIALGPVIRIFGYCSNPSFSLGDYNYSWSGVVQQGYELVIDFNMLTCYLAPPSGKKVNAMNKFNGTFHKIPKGRSEVIQFPANIAQQANTRWQTRVLW